MYRILDIEVDLEAPEIGGLAVELASAIVHDGELVSCQIFESVKGKAQAISLTLT